MTDGLGHMMSEHDDRQDTKFLVKCVFSAGGAVATQNTGGKECLPGPAFCGYAM